MSGDVGASSRLIREMLDIDRTLATLAAERDRSVEVRLRIAGIAHELAAQGVADTAFLPPRVRAIVEHILIALRAYTPHPDMYQALARCAFHTARVVAQAYEEPPVDGETQ